MNLDFLNVNIKNIENKIIFTADKYKTRDNIIFLYFAKDHYKRLFSLTDHIKHFENQVFDYALSTFSNMGDYERVSALLDQLERYRQNRKDLLNISRIQAKQAFKRGLANYERRNTAKKLSSALNDYDLTVSIITELLEVAATTDKLNKDNVNELNDLYKKKTYLINSIFRFCQFSRDVGLNPDLGDDPEIKTIKQGLEQQYLLNKRELNTAAQ